MSYPFARCNIRWSNPKSLSAYSKCRSAHKRRSGNVLLVTAWGFTVLAGSCALAVDLGLIVFFRAKLQITCDAAALAGAQDLPADPAKAEVQARKAAQLNGLPSPEISFPNPRQIRVSGQRHVTFLFAPLLGIRSNNVGATAVAGRSYAVKGIPEVVPLAITTGTYEEHCAGDSFQIELVRQNKDDFMNGSVVSLDFRVDTSGKSGSLFQDDLTYGFPNTISIGENYNVLTAADTSQSANLIQAMQERFSLSAAASYGDTGSNYTYPNYPTQSQRIITIVVSSPKLANNSNPVVPILYFAPVYIENIWETTGAEKKTILLLRILPGRAYNSDDPRVVVGDENTPDTGITAVRLGE